ncbi:MAG: hypothetical protein IJY90_02990 [Clostridia bacterium]|nr:hypothetical protein [Clostridia bacterium]
MKNEINAEMILNYIKENNLTKTSFCKLCKIGLDTFERIMSNIRNYRIIALFKIARVMKIGVYQMFC